MAAADITTAAIGYVYYCTRGNPGQQPLKLTYRRSEPLSVGLEVHDAAGVADWRFARDLLADGLRAHVGAGDVTVWPGAAAGHAHIGVGLSSPDGVCRMWLPRPAVEKFLRATFRMVRRGCEDVSGDLDAAIARLLRREGWLL